MDLFQSCGHCWVFQIGWHIECSTFTASSLRIWNSSTGISSPPLALFLVMLSKAHLTSHSRMSCSRWVITPSWLSGSWRSFLYLPGSYATLLFTALDLASITSYIHNWYCFCFGSIPSFFLELFLHWSPVHIEHLQTWGVLLPISHHFAFSCCSWGSQGKNTAVVCHSLLQWTTFCQTSPPWPDHLGWPDMAWFSDLDKTVVLWSDWLVFCDYGFSVSALWCPLTTPTVLLGFLLPWTWGISSWLLHQSAAAAPYLGRGVSSQGRPLWPWTWSSSSRPSCAHAATAPWRWGCSSQPPPLTSGMGYLLSGIAPDLGPEVAPLVCCPSPWAWVSYSRPRGNSSQPPPLTLELGELLCMAPALLQPGVLGCHPWPWARGSSSWPRFCTVRQVGKNNHLISCLSFRFYTVIWLL